MADALEALQLEALERESRRLRAENRRLRAENRQLRADNERLARRVAALEARVAELTQLLEEARRAGKRQAAPFSRGEPTEDPKPPGQRPDHPGTYSCGSKEGTTLSHKVTSKAVASDAGRVLRDPRATAAERSVAGLGVFQQSPPIEHKPRARLPEGQARPSPRDEKRRGLPNLGAGVTIFVASSWSAHRLFGSFCVGFLMGWTGHAMAGPLIAPTHI